MYFNYNMVYLWQYIMVLFQWPSCSALLILLYRPCRIYIKRPREAEEEEKEEDRQPSASAKVRLPRVLLGSPGDPQTHRHRFVTQLFWTWSLTWRPVGEILLVIRIVLLTLVICSINATLLLWHIKIYIYIYIWLPSFHVAFLAWSRPSFHRIFGHETCYHLTPHVFGWLIYTYYILIVAHYDSTSKHTYIIYIYHSILDTC